MINNNDNNNNNNIDNNNNIIKCIESIETKIEMYACN